ncbi:MAG: hypothetical protein Q8K55_04450 [Gemmatimonadaceae bacterium]|nr:hypothetical protein [Gemmatimonadaceae bacterium]
MTMTSLNARLARAALAATALTAVVGCADKEFTGSKAALSPRIALQITATGLPASQVAASPLFLLTGAFYTVPSNSTDRDDKEMRILTFRWTRVAQGTQQITLPVDIAPCLADRTRLGSKDGCSLYVVAIVTPDSFDVASDTGDADPMMHAFDYAFPVGPFEVVAGRTPVIPPIDLSLSRFGVVNWQQDEALRLGGAVNPSGLQFAIGGIATITGVASGAGAPTIIALTVGPADVNSTLMMQMPNYPQLQLFENGQWRRVTATTAASGTIFLDATAFAANDVYIASTQGVYRYDGSSFSRAGGVTDSLWSIGGATVGTNKYVIAGGKNGTVWIGSNTTWQRYVLPVSGQLDGACITGPSEAFVASSVSGESYRFNGSSWSSVPGPANLTNVGKVDLQCPAPGQAYVDTWAGPLLKWSVSGWSPMPTTGIGPGRMLRVGVGSASELWGVGDSASTDRAYYRFNGSVWQEVGRTRYVQWASRPWVDPRGGAAYIMGTLGRLEKMTSSGVTVLSYQPALRDAIMTSASSAFVVGGNLFLARWDGTKWTVDKPPAGTMPNRLLQGVWSDGPSNAWAVGALGTILRYNGSAWSVVSDSSKPVVSATEHYNGVWGSASDVWIAGDAGITRCKTTAGCAREYQAAGMYGIWGSSASNIFAVGSGGKIVRFNGTAWSPMTSPTSRLLVRLSGSGASDVWAVGDSVLIHYDGTQWTDVKLSDHAGFMRSRSPSGFSLLFQIGLWARGPKEVYLGSEYGMIARWDGTEWREVLPGNIPRRRLIAITGASDGCALALTEGQSGAAQPTLWRGIGPNGCLSAPMTPPSVWP